VQAQSRSILHILTVRATNLLVLHEMNGLGADLMMCLTIIRAID